MHWEKAARFPYLRLSIVKIREGFYSTAGLKECKVNGEKQQDGSHPLQALAIQAKAGYLTILIY
jgi:hypothetical protein